MPFLNCDSEVFLLAYPSCKAYSSVFNFCEIRMNHLLNGNNFESILELPRSLFEKRSQRVNCLNRLKFRFTND